MKKYKLSLAIGIGVLAFAARVNAQSVNNNMVNVALSDLKIESLTNFDAKKSADPSPQSVQIGDSVIISDMIGGSLSFREAEVIGDRGSIVVAKFSDGTRSGVPRSSVVAKSGCRREFCVGQKVFVSVKGFTPNSTAYPATLIGLSIERKFVVRFEGGPKDQVLSGLWPSEYFASLKGSHEGFAVGDTVFNTVLNESVEIIGLEPDGRFILKYLAGSHAGDLVDKWPSLDFVKTRE